MKTKFLLFLMLALSFLVSCDKEEDERMPDTSYNPVLDPEQMQEGVSNSFLPFNVGSIYTYESQTDEGLETTVITVLSETRTVSGIECTIVHDQVSLNGVLVEDTYDWYAQDMDGNVWYMGEDVSNYENGVFIDKEGSFEAGVDGAKPGIVMMNSPVLEFPYRQEYYFNNAEDYGKVIDKDISVTTVYGVFNHCLKTADWNALEPDAPLEYKYYAPGIGLVKEETEGSIVYTDLVSIH